VPEGLAQSVQVRLRALPKHWFTGSPRLVFAGCENTEKGIVG